MCNVQIEKQYGFVAMQSASARNRSLMPRMHTSTPQATHTPHILLLIIVLNIVHKRINMKLDQGALGMSDPLGPLQLALKPNSASSINRPLLNFYYCAHWSLIMGNTEAWKQLNWYSTNSDLTVPAEVICQEGGGYMPTRRRRLYAKTAEVICQLPIDTLRTQT